ncbi:unnamed protein product [Rhizophagus irregularis]|nr:unnamed protein product [Rhizophagus irregularis]CAB5384193.1 unnamed protein product [Rhizophagus irregularis]
METVYDSVDITQIFLDLQYIAPLESEAPSLKRHCSFLASLLSCLQNQISTIHPLKKLILFWNHNLCHISY